MFNLTLTIYFVVTFAEQMPACSMEMFIKEFARNKIRRMLKEIEWKKYNNSMFGIVLKCFVFNAAIEINALKIKREPCSNILKQARKQMVSKLGNINITDITIFFDVKHCIQKS